jgi:hypothetical protein
MPYAPWGESNQDVFGLLAGALAAKAECVGHDEGIDKSEATAADEKGTIVAATVYDERAAPSEEYTLKATLALSGLYLGDSKALSPYGYAVVTGIDIATVNGGDAPKISFSGETGASATNRKFALPTFNLLATLEAQLFGACTLTNCHATGGKLSAKATMARVLGKSGICVAHNISGGVVEVTIDVNADSAAAPSVTAESGWTVTKPLTMKEVNTEYATGSVTLRKHLTVYVPA